MRPGLSALLVLPLLACGSEPLQAEPIALQVLGQGPDLTYADIPAGSTSPSTANGTDFGEWSAGTIGNPFPPKVIGFRIVNAGATGALLEGPPFVEVTGAEAARFPLPDLSSGALAAGQSVDFTLGFDGMGGLGTHTAQVAVHVRGADDYVFTVSGTTVPPGQH